jgi:hypothetical protein
VGAPNPGSLCPSYGLVVYVHRTAGRRSSRKLAASGIKCYREPDFRRTEFSETQLVPLLILRNPICRDRPIRSGPGLNARASGLRGSRKPRACTCIRPLTGSAAKLIMGISTILVPFSWRTYWEIGGERERGSRAPGNVRPLWRTHVTSR